MADASDLKSDTCESVWVQVPLSALLPKSEACELALWKDREDTDGGIGRRILEDQETIEDCWMLGVPVAPQL